jgi:hypothetical protein
MTTRAVFTPRRLAICSALATALSGLVASPALASTAATASPTPNTSACTAPTLSQPLLSIGDSNWYTLTPGETVDNFNGSGWTLSGGAQIKSVPLADGATGSVLDLPTGSQAVSPTLCVNSGYKTIRTEVRDLVGSAGVHFYVSYEGTSSWGTPQDTGLVHGQQTNWTMSDPVNIQPGNSTGWELVHFTLVPAGTKGDFQIYNFWLDPRMCR